MSGGSLEYLCFKIHQAIDEIHRHGGFTAPHHKRFLKHLSKVADALHDIEWVMDCDMGPGDEDKAIKKVLNANRPRTKKNTIKYQKPTKKSKVKFDSHIEAIDRYERKKKCPMHSAGAECDVCGGRF